MAEHPSADEDVAQFLASYSPPIIGLTQRLRELVLQATPDAIERIRPGWRLLGYDLPTSRKGRTVYFAWVWPEVEHVHVGWQAGTLMRDPDRLLRGAHLKLKKVRYLTFGPGERIPAKRVIDFTRDAARISSMSRGERELIASIIDA